MSESDINVLLAAGVITALAAAIFVYRLNKELDRRQKRANERSATRSNGAPDF
jgi:hypothetical protein